MKGVSMGLRLSQRAQLQCPTESESSRMGDGPKQRTIRAGARVFLAVQSAPLIFAETMDAILLSSLLTM